MNLAYLTWLALRPAIKRASSQLDAESHVTPEGIIAREEGSSNLLVSLRRYRRMRATALALHSLDDSTLADIGIERFEIDAIVFHKKLP
jgi:uncharacterized protein YjiS (DUF1127 family)